MTILRSGLIGVFLALWASQGLTQELTPRLFWPAPKDTRGGRFRRFNRDRLCRSLLRVDGTLFELIATGCADRSLYLDLDHAQRVFA